MAPRRRRPRDAPRANAGGLLLIALSACAAASAGLCCFAGGAAGRAPARWAAGREASEVALRARTATDSYLKELPSGDFQLQGELPESAIPGDNFLSVVLPSAFTEVTPQGILINFLLPSLAFFILLTLSTPLVDKYLLGEEYEVDWSGRSGRYWDILFGKGAKAYIGKPQFADGDNLRRGAVDPLGGAEQDESSARKQDESSARTK